MNDRKTYFGSGIVFFMLVLSYYAFAVESLPQDVMQLIMRARKPVLSENWALLTGKVSHKKKDSPIVEYPIHLGIRFTPEFIFAKIILDEKESYFLSQPYSGNETTIIKEGESDSNIMSRIGIRPEDLTLSFLFWTPEKFLGYDSFKMSDCAKIAMLSPDSKEKAVITLNKEYAFPLKIEWYKVDEVKPYRIMEVSSFKKEKDLWFVDEILVTGPGWRTKISFDETKSGSTEAGIPENLFRQIQNIEKSSDNQKIE